MKKLYVMTFLAIGLSACSSSDEVSPEKGGATDATGFMTVNIVSPDQTTRAEENGEIYEDGLPHENAISSLRLYMFDALGNPFMIEEDGGISYVDQANPAFAPDDDRDNDIEKYYQVTATFTGNRRPAKIIAVLNPPADLTEPSPTVSELLKKTGDYMSLANAANPSFVITNSAYVNTSDYSDFENDVVVEVGNHVHQTAEAAQNDPVVIYVERAVAKIRMNLAEGISDITKMIAAKDKEGNLITDSEGKQIYVKFHGWNVTQYNDIANLVKDSKPSWNSKENPFFGWLDLNRLHRHFWGVNPADAQLQYTKIYDSNDVDNSVLPSWSNLITDFSDKEGIKNCIYVHGNAANADNDYVAKPTDIIFAAQLVDEQGSPFEIAEYALQYYSVKDLKKVYAYLVNEKYKLSLKESDIDFITATEAAGGEAPEKGRYYVYAVLASGTTLPDSVTETDVNAYLKAMGHAKIWKDGYTYYYYEIRHLNKNKNAGDEEGYLTPGYYGVVRNHIYNVTLKSVTGLGTPVFDPDEEIIPEKPEDGDTLVAAEIYILSWRLVDHDMDLVW